MNRGSDNPHQWQEGQREQAANGDAAGDARSHFLPDYLSGPLDPDRMRLSPQERQWALEIKEAIQNEAELDDVSDMMCAQIALVEWESRNMAKALERAYNLQHYREEFDIDDSLNQGKRTMEYFIRRNPGYFLHFFYAEDRYAIAFDMTKFDISSVLSTPREKKTMLSGAYYQNHAFSPDLAAIRQGVVWILECEGFLWKAPKMVNFEVWRTGFQDVASNYPFILHRMRFCNTGVMVNTLCSMIRPYISKEMHSKFEIGQQTDVRMDQICLVPDLATAMDRIIREMCESLRRRYEAEKNFRL